MKIQIMLGVIAGLVLSLFWLPAPRSEAAARALSAAQIKDSNAQVVQQPPTAQLWDGLALTASISNSALTSNVVTITTSAAHGYTVGQRVTVLLLTGPTGFAAMNGTFVIASVPTTTTFTYAKTNANLTSTASTGTTTAYQLSPMPTATTELKLVFPGGAFALVVIPTATVTDCTFSYTSTGGIGGTFPLYANQSNVICGTEGDVVYIQRPTTTPIAFQFAQGK